MTEENKEVTPPVETPETPPVDTPTDAPKTITGVAQEAPAPAFATEDDIKYQGLDPRMFSEDGNITITGAKRVIEELAQSKALAEKQRDDFHKTLSAKGQVPKKVEDYIDKYSNPRYESLKSNPSVNESMKQLAETFHKNGINPKEADKIYDDMFAIMEKANVVDVRSPEEHNKWVDKQMELLGANAQQIVNDTTSFIQGFVGINEEQKKELIGMMNTKGASVINALYAITKDLDFKRIPVATQASTGLEPDPVLFKKYQEAQKAKDHYTMDKIIADRAKAGRPANFYASANGGM